MLNPQQLFGAIQEQVNQVFPEFGKAAQEEISSNIKLAVSGVINKLDLVSREEFETQQVVLARTRELLENLEKTVADLESRLGDASK